MSTHCIILVGSSKAADRVMENVSKFIKKKLGLKVNMTKTKITKPNDLKYLGFGFYHDKTIGTWKLRAHESSIKKFKQALKRHTIRKNSMKMEERIRKLNQVIRGWINYFSICNMKTHMEKIDAHLRTRLRVVIWKQWKVPSKRQWGLQKLGIGKDLAKTDILHGK